MSLYSIQAAAQMTGISDACIRAWEKRYKSIVPSRNDSNHRLYSEDDIERLTLFNKLTSIGMRISHLSKLTTDELKKVYLSVTKNNFDESALGLKKSADTFFESLYVIEEGINSRRFDVAYHEVKKVITTNQVNDLALKFFPSIEGLCFSWKEKNLIEQEHIQAFERYTHSIVSTKVQRERQYLRGIRSITVSLTSNKNRLADSGVTLLLASHRVDDVQLSNESNTDFLLPLVNVTDPSMIILIGDKNNPEITKITSTLSANSKLKLIIYDQNSSAGDGLNDSATGNAVLFTSIFELNQFFEKSFQS